MITTSAPSPPISPTDSHLLELVDSARPSTSGEALEPQLSNTFEVGLISGHQAQAVLERRCGDERIRKAGAGLPADTARAFGDRPVDGEALEMVRAIG